MRKIFLITLGLSTALFAFFSKNGNIVTDPSTGLQWQDDNAVASSELSWKAGIKYCEALILDGYSDWRLPSIDEFSTIIIRNISGFEHGLYYVYWSSTTDEEKSNHAWVSFFGDSFTGHYKKTNKFPVRCVREQMQY